MENEKLEKMYDEYYMTAEGLDKSYIRETLALNLTEGYEKGYSTIQKIFKPEELKRLLGVCAAYYMKKIDNDTYVNAIAKFKIRIRELESKTAADREVKEMLLGHAAESHVNHSWEVMVLCKSSPGCCG